MAGYRLRLFAIVPVAPAEVTHSRPIEHGRNGDLCRPLSESPSDKGTIKR